MIRKAEKTDFEKMIEIAKNDGFEHPDMPNLDWIKSRIKLGDEFYVYGNVLGFICFQPQFSRGSRLHFISVMKSEQGKGIGGSLVSYVGGLTRKFGKNKLYLYVHQKNQKAIDFYLKHKFAFAGIFLDKYGEKEHALLMCKEV